MSKDEHSPCGPPCEELTDRERHFHLEILTNGANAAKAWAATADGEIGEKSAESGGSRALSRAKVSAALAYHRAPESKAAQDSYAAQVERLTQRSSSTLEDFVEVSHVAPDPERLRGIADIEDERERAVAVRRMQSVRLIDWGEIDPAKLAAVSEISQAADGTIKLKLEPRGPAESLLAKIKGHEAPKVLEITTDEAAFEALEEVFGEPGSEE